MDKDKATETIVPTIAPEGDKAPVLQDDAEARFTKLETEKENYRKAYLIEVDRNKKARDEGSITEEEERMANIARKVVTEAQISGVDREKEALLEKTLKENRELKLARLNKEPPAAMGTHSETIAVRDTSISAEQMAYFKSRNWSDKDIERYKKNLSKRI